jgi:hypothetical protein
MDVGAQRHSQAALPLGMMPCQLCRGRVVLRAGLDGSGKFSSPPAFDPRTVQTVGYAASCGVGGYFQTPAQIPDKYFKIQSVRPGSRPF